MLVFVAQAWVNGSHFFFLPSDRILNDFLYFWGAARLFWTGGVRLAFHPLLFNSWLATHVVPGSMEQFATWSYPPTTLLFLLPVGWIPLPYALITWDLATFFVLGIVLLVLFRKPWLVLVVLLSPAALYNLLLEQNGALTAALIIAGIWLTDRRPLLAGVCIGALVIKPQLAIVIPFALAAGGHWKAFISAALTSLSLILLSVVLFGLGVWQAYFHNTVPVMTAQLMHGYGIAPQYAMPTTFVTVQGWGADIRMAGLCQGLSTLLAIAMTVRVWGNQKADRTYRNALTCTIILLATPFGYVYDLIPAMLAVVLAAQEKFSMGSSWPERLALPSLWLWPGISTMWNGYFGLPPIGSVLLLAVAFCLLWRMEANSGSSRPMLQAFGCSLWMPRSASRASDKPPVGNQASVY